MSFYKLRLHFLAFFDHVPSLHFLCSKPHVFLTTYPPLSVNVICESSLHKIGKFELQIGSWFFFMIFWKQIFHSLNWDILQPVTWFFLIPSTEKENCWINTYFSQSLVHGFSYESFWNIVHLVCTIWFLEKGSTFFKDKCFHLFWA